MMKAIQKGEVALMLLLGMFFVFGSLFWLVSGFLSSDVEEPQKVISVPAENHEVKK